MRGEIERDNRGGGRRMKARKMGNNNPTVVFNRGRERWGGIQYSWLWKNT